MTGAGDTSQGPWPAEQLDALREVANMGTGAAATELYRMTGSGIGMAVPRSSVVPLSAVVAAYGPAERPVTAVGAEVSGDLEMLLALLLRPEQVPLLRRMLEREDGDAEVVLEELGERLCSSFAHAVGDLTGMRLAVRSVGATTDMLGSVVESLVASTVADAEQVLTLDAVLDVERGHVELRLVCAPAPASVEVLLRRLGVAVDPRSAEASP